MFYQKHFPCFAAGKPRYTVPQNILSTKKRRIFLVAVPLMNQTSASDNSLVKLRFHHTLTRIAIYVKTRRQHNRKANHGILHPRNEKRYPHLPYPGRQ